MDYENASLALYGGLQQDRVRVSRVEGQHIAQQIRGQILGISRLTDAELQALLPPQYLVIPTRP